MPRLNFGANEALYKALLDEKERYIKSLEAQIAELKGTKTEQWYKVMNLEMSDFVFISKE